MTTVAILCVTAVVLAATPVPTKGDSDGEFRDSHAGTHLYFEFGDGVVMALIPAGVRSAVTKYHRLSYADLVGMAHDRITRHGPVPEAVAHSAGDILRVYTPFRVYYDLYVFNLAALTDDEIADALMLRVAQSPAVFVAVYDGPGDDADDDREYVARDPYPVPHTAPQYDRSQTAAQYWESIAIAKTSDIDPPTADASRATMPIYSMRSSGNHPAFGRPAVSVRGDLRKIAAYLASVRARDVYSHAILETLNTILARLSKLEDRDAAKNAGFI